MSKIIFDSFIHPGNKVKILVYRENGTVEQNQECEFDYYGSVVLLAMEEE